MSNWTIAPNPAFAEQTPRPLTPACHDGSPFLTIRCTCGENMHLHETQIAAVPAVDAIGARCPACRAVLEFGDELRQAFADMREAGWIARVASDEDHNG